VSGDSLDLICVDCGNPFPKITARPGRPRCVACRRKSPSYRKAKAKHAEQTRCQKGGKRPLFIRQLAAEHQSISRECR
jgi:hypothetical protein